MRFRFSSEDGDVLNVSDNEGVAKLAARGFCGIAEVVDERNLSLAQFHNIVVLPGDVDELVDVLVNLVGDLHVGGADGDSAAMVYTTGDCDVLAKAISELYPNGKIVGIFDPFDENGEMLECPYLIHAGVLVGEKVVDISGISNKEQWLESWSHLGSTDTYFAEIEENDLNRIRPHGATVVDFACAQNVAAILAIALENQIHSAPTAIPSYS